MKISTKCRYGVRALLDMAKNGSNGPVKRRDIAKREAIPMPYLENILVTLRKAGIISTARGAAGGYRLKKRPDEIKLLGVVEALEGSLAPLECVDNPSSCKRLKGCESHQLWKQLYEAHKNILENMTLADLANNGKAEWVI
ncbi:MAG: Rrf2 family transcriptional regulator [Fibrobacterota bacterium]